jgi:predicted NBD/HSP70 family sugar kinase
LARTERGATQETVRRHNLAALLGHLHRYGPTSRARLTRLLGLNRATIGDLVDDLVSRGLVEEQSEPERAARGRPSKVVAASSARCRALAVQVGVDAIEVALVGLGGPTLWRRRVSITRAADRTPEQVIRMVARLALPRLAAPGHGVIGVGVAVPGSVSPDGCVVNFAPNLGWHQVPLARLLAERLDFDGPVQIGNDANLGAMAEHSRGVGIRSSDLIYLHAEVGVGGGIITGGRMLTGARGYAGEVGHMQVNPAGMPCHCGARGCWETEVGEDALVRRAGLTPGGRAKVELVLANARRGDPTCLGAVHETARWIGVGLVNMVTSMDPEMVILGGVFEDILELARPVLGEQLNTSSRYSRPSGVALMKPKFDGSSVLMGAAELGLQRVLSDPSTLPQAGSPGDGHPGQGDADGSPAGSTSGGAGNRSVSIVDALDAGSMGVTRQTA